VCVCVWAVCVFYGKLDRETDIFKCTDTQLSQSASRCGSAIVISYWVVGTGVSGNIITSSVFQQM